jgi:hypothetical protein
LESRERVSKKNHSKITKTKTMKGHLLSLAVVAFAAGGVYSNESTSYFILPASFKASLIEDRSSSSNWVSFVMSDTIEPGKAILFSVPNVNYVNNLIYSNHLFHSYVMESSEYQDCKSGNFQYCTYFTGASCVSALSCYKSYTFTSSRDLKVLVYNPSLTSTVQLSGTLALRNSKCIFLLLFNINILVGTNQNLFSIVIGTSVGGALLAIILITVICIRDCREIRRHRNPHGMNAGTKVYMQSSAANLVAGEQQPVAMAPIGGPSAPMYPYADSLPTYA